MTLLMPHHGTVDVVGIRDGTEGARDAYQQALAISERLAQAEPDRADYQRDLAVSWVKVGQSANSREALVRAFAVLSSLNTSGRLNPADLPLLESLEHAIQRG